MERESSGLPNEGIPDDPTETSAVGATVLDKSVSVFLRAENE